MAMREIILYRHWPCVRAKGIYDNPNYYEAFKTSWAAKRTKFFGELNDKDTYMIIVAPSVKVSWEQLLPFLPKESIVYQSPETHNINYPEYPTRIQMILLNFSKTGVPKYVPEF